MVRVTSEARSGAVEHAPDPALRGESAAEVAEGGVARRSQARPARRPTRASQAAAFGRASHDPTAAQLAHRTRSAEEPSVPEDDEVVYRRVDGHAFRSVDGEPVDPTMADVDQGGLGDCYLHAGMAAVAERDPELVRRMVSENEDGTFTVRLRVQEEGEWRTVPVRVNPTFPHGTGEDAGHVYADPTPGNQSDTLWPALVEKAWAQHNGGYDEIEGGSSGRAMEVITGRPSTKTSITSTTDPETVWERVREGVRGDHPMTLGSLDEAPDYPGDHAYTIIDASERDGDKYIRIYNPWGLNDGSQTLEDRILEVPLDRLTTNFDSLYVNDS